MEQRSIGSSPDLAPAVSELIEIAEEIGASEQAARARKALERFLAHHVNLVVFGEFKRGKSTLINALLGRSILPTGVVPLTALPTVIRFGEDEGVCVKLDAFEEWHPLADLPKFVSERLNPENRRGVHAVEVFVQSDLLREGLQIVDTPGFGSTHLHNTREAASYLPNADAAIMVIGSSPPVGEAEREFLRAAKEFAAKILFVQNKADLMDQEELGEAIDFNRAIIAEEIGSDDIAILPVASRSALLAKEQGNPTMLAHSHFPELERQLASIQSHEAADIGRRSLCRAATALSDILMTKLEVEERLSQMAFDDVEARAEKFGDELRRLRDAKADALIAVKETTRKRLVETLEADLAAFKERELPQMVALFYADIESAGAVSAAISKINLEFADRLMRAIKQWTPAEEQRLTAALRDRLQPIRGLVAGFRSELADTASKLFTIAIPASELEVELPQVSHFQFRTWELKLELGPASRMWLRIIGWRRASARLKRHILLLAWRQLEMHSGRLRYDFVTRLDAGLTEFATALDESFESLGRALESSVARAKEIRETAAKGVMSDSEARILKRQRIAKINLFLSTHP